MKRIIFGLITIAAAGAVIATGATGAFFGDTETSTGNTFAAGAIDLQVDNDSYYNRNRCTYIQATTTPGFYWQGSSPYPISGTPCTTRFGLSDLDNGLLFFNFTDLKPDDEGENSLSSGVQTLFDLATATPFAVALADAQNNVWTPNTPGPIPANQTVYIGKAWCFGDLTLDPVSAGQGQNPSVDPGVDCDGVSLGNITQTDGVTLDVAFRAVQARHNDNFLCDEGTRLANITVTKEITNNNGGNNVIPDFQLFIDNGITNTPVSSGVSIQVAPGNYTVTETGVSGYVASFNSLADDCDANGQLTLVPGDNKTCVITNDDQPALITLIKSVINNSSGNAQPNQFGLREIGRA